MVRFKAVTCRHTRCSVFAAYGLNYSIIYTLFWEGLHDLLHYVFLGNGITKILRKYCQRVQTEMTVEAGGLGQNVCESVSHTSLVEVFLSLVVHFLTAHEALLHAHLNTISLF